MNSEKGTITNFDVKIEKKNKGSVKFWKKRKILSLDFKISDFFLKHVGWWNFYDSIEREKQSYADEIWNAQPLFSIR